MCGALGEYTDVVAMPLNCKVRTIDRCIHQIIAALNAGGVETFACCCGHGKQAGTILLEDGRTLLVLPKETWGYPENGGVSWSGSRADEITRMVTRALYGEPPKPPEEPLCEEAQLLRVSYEGPLPGRPHGPDLERIRADHEEALRTGNRAKADAAFGAMLATVQQEREARR